MKVSMRFEILKRDQFTCHYCGRTPPNVLLHVDHVVPRSAGGTDDPANLITACADCNQGKSSRLLEEGSAPTVSADVVKQMRERVKQAREYAKLVREIEQNRTVDVANLLAFWDRENPYGKPPTETSIGYFLRFLPVHEIEDAILSTASADRKNRLTDKCRYFYACCRNKMRETGGSDASA